MPPTNIDLGYGLCNRGKMSIYHLAQQAGKLEDLAKARLRQHAKNDGTLLRHQLARFGVCPCECHTGPAMHTSHPCCEHARMMRTLMDEDC
jgi:hypothetical protein